MTLRAMILGAAPDTHNLGVGALITSALAALNAADGTAEILVADNGRGRRAGNLQVGNESRPVTFIGAKASKRFTRRDSLYRVYISSLAKRTHSYFIEDLRGCDVVLDVSGGDSFSDIYGRERFLQVLLHKRIALAQGRPLVLLPQTIGPFASSTARRMAKGVYERADVVIARDQWSYEQLRSMMGAKFDSARHWIGPDMAFSLPPSNPPLDSDTRAFLAGPRPTAGVNISGLLYLDERSSARFGLADDYRRVARKLIEALLTDTDAQVLLVGHVVAPPGRQESDIQALEHLAGVFGNEPRIHIAPPPKSSSAAKGLIAQTDWFVGSRMHATIAALASNIPAASLAYSDKAGGVFATVGREEDVADLRVLAADSTAAAMVRSFMAREAARERLRERLPAVRERAQQQVVDAVEIARRPPGSIR